MAMCPGDTTQWEDIQVRMGNFAPRPDKETTKTRNKAESQRIDIVEHFDPLENRTDKELDVLEDDIEEDALARLRRKRLEEMKEASKAAKFGEVLPVRHINFIEQVTDGSANGQWVLVFLCVEARTACQLLMRPWEEAAKRFPAVKFMTGRAGDVVPNYPDDKSPGVLVYRNTECEKQIIGIDEWGGTRCSVDCVEWVLAKLGVVETDFEEDPRSAASSWRKPAGRRDEDSGSDEDAQNWDDHSDRCYASTRLGNVFKLS